MYIFFKKYILIFYFLNFFENNLCIFEKRNKKLIELGSIGLISLFILNNFKNEYNKKKIKKKCENFLKLKDEIKDFKPCIEYDLEIEPVIIYKYAKYKANALSENKCLNNITKDFISDLIELFENNKGNLENYINNNFEIKNNILEIKIKIKDQENEKEANTFFIDLINKKFLNNNDIINYEQENIFKYTIKSIMIDDKS